MSPPPATTDNDDERDGDDEEDCSIWSTIVPHSAEGDRGTIRRSWNAADGVDPVRTLEGCRTLYETFRRGCDRNPLGPCLGFRAVSSHTGFATPYIYSSYTECLARVNSIAAGLHHLNLMPEIPQDEESQTQQSSLRFMAFYLQNCVEWVLVQHACFTLGGTVVPLYDTLGPDTVEYCLKQTCAGTILCSRAQLNTLRRVVIESSQSNDDNDSKTSLPFDITAIVVDGVTTEAAEQARKTRGRLKLISLAEVEAVGAQYLTEQSERKAYSHHRPPSSRDVAFILYTSGTTGNPKGVVLTHENILAAVGGSQQCLELELTVADRHLSYLPLGHIFEHLIQTHVLCCGGSVAFYRGDPLLLFEDVQACRPTVFIVVPRVLNKLHDKIQAGFAAAGGVKKRLFDAGLAAKMNAIRSTGRQTHAVYDFLIFNKIKKALGLDHLRMMISGAAPLSASVMMFFRSLLGVPVLEGYGQTEGAGCATVGHVDDVQTAGHVGGPSCPCEIRLVDVTEMGYLHTDRHHGGGTIPVAGRGEIWIRGANVFGGYYKDPINTAEALTVDGWLKTGDIGCWRVDYGGVLQIIDRKKNIFKLAQGEYVAPEKIENVLVQSPLIAQAFVHGDSLQTSLVAIVVPDEEPVLQWYNKNKERQNQEQRPSFAELCKTSRALKSAVERDIARLSKQNGLHGFERVKAIYLEPEPLSVDNGLLTPTLKLKRKAARDAYRTQIQRLYREIASAENSNTQHQQQSKL